MKDGACGSNLLGYAVNALVGILDLPGNSFTESPPPRSAIWRTLAAIPSISMPDMESLLTYPAKEVVGATGLVVSCQEREWAFMRTGQ